MVSSDRVLPTLCSSLETNSYDIHWRSRKFFSSSAFRNNFSRHEGITMNMDTISSTIQPGNVVIRKGRDGSERKRYTEIVHGYFWMLRDMRKTGDKPILSNTQPIPEAMAKAFPPLQVRSLSGTKYEIPSAFAEKNRSGDPNAHCTLLAVSFRDYGYQRLSGWINPFKEHFGPDHPRVNVARLNISEGFLSKYFLQVPIASMMKANTPKEEHDMTLLHFGRDLENFRDSLRMHNVMTAYVFLLDGLNRVRFAGSGTAEPSDIEYLVKVTEEIVPKKKPPTRRP